MQHGQGDRSRRRDSKNRERERGREEDVQIGLISPDGLLDKSRQMEIFTRTGLKSRPAGPNAFKNG